MTSKTELAIIEAVGVDAYAALTPLQRQAAVVSLETLPHYNRDTYLNMWRSAEQLRTSIDQITKRALEEYSEYHKQEDVS